MQLPYHIYFCRAPPRGRARARRLADGAGRAEKAARQEVAGQARGRAPEDAAVGQGAGADRRRRAARPRLQALPRRAVRGGEEGAARPRPEADAEPRLRALPPGAVGAAVGRAQGGARALPRADAVVVALHDAGQLARRRLRLGGGRPRSGAQGLRGGAAVGERRASSRRWRASASARRSPTARRRARRRRRSSSGARSTSTIRCIRSPRRRWRG